MCAVAPVCISASVSSVAAYSAVQSVARSSIISYSLRRRLWLLPTIYIVIIHHIHTLHIRTYTCLSVLINVYYTWIELRASERRTLAPHVRRDTHTASGSVGVTVECSGLSSAIREPRYTQSNWGVRGGGERRSPPSVDSNSICIASRIHRP